MEWNGQLFVDMALPFGLCSSPVIFNALAEALAYYMINYMYMTYINIWMTLPLLVLQCYQKPQNCIGGDGVAVEKTEDPATNIILLGGE